MFVMSAIALLFGIHMVMAIGGADMPVVVSMAEQLFGMGGCRHGLYVEQRFC